MDIIKNSFKISYYSNPNNLTQFSNEELLNKAYQLYLYDCELESLQILQYLEQKLIKNNETDIITFYDFYSLLSNIHKNLGNLRK